RPTSRPRASLPPTGLAPVMCSTELSCTLVRAPRTMASESARTTAPNHTLASSPSVALPMTVAFGAMYTSRPRMGLAPASEWMVIAGYFDDDAAGFALVDAAGFGGGALIDGAALTLAFGVGAALLVGFAVDVGAAVLVLVDAGGDDTAPPVGS